MLTERSSVHSLSRMVNTRAQTARDGALGQGLQEAAPGVQRVSGMRRTRSEDLGAGLSVERAGEGRPALAPRSNSPPPLVPGEGLDGETGQVSPERAETVG